MRPTVVIAIVVALLADAALLADPSTQVLGVVLPVAVLLLALLISEPTTFVLLYVASRPLVDAAVHVQVGQLTLGTLWGGGLMIVLAAYWVLKGVREPVGSRGWGIPVAFLIAYAAFCFGRGDLVYWFSNWVKLASLAAVAFTIEHIAATREGQVRIVRAGTIMAVLQLGVIGLAVAQNQYGAAYYTYGQYNSLFQGPHGLASMAVLLSTFAWFGAMRARSSRWPYVLLAALIGVAVALALVRTTFLAFALIALWFLWWSLRSRRAGAVVAAVVSVAGVAAVVYSLQDMVVSRLSDLLLLSSSGAAELGVGSGRLGIWEAVWRSATSSASAVFFGQGADASFRATAAVFVQSGSMWSHNDYLEFFITGGVVLAGLYLCLVGWMFQSGRRLAKDSRQSPEVRDAGRLMAVVVVAFAVMALFNGIAFYQATIAMGLVVGLARGMSLTPQGTFLDDGGSGARVAGPTEEGRSG